MSFCGVFKVSTAVAFCLLLFDSVALSSEVGSNATLQKSESTLKSNVQKRSQKKTSATTKGSETKKPKPVDVSPEQSSSLGDEEKSSLEKQQNSTAFHEQLSAEGSIYIGSYSFRGFEAGLMAAVSLLETPPSSTHFGLAALAEIGVHRARWSHNHVSYNRFAVTADARFDIVSQQPIRPFLALGVGQSREWFHRGDKAEVDTITSVKIGTFINLNPSFAVRFELVPALSAIRVGSTLKI